MKKRPFCLESTMKNYLQIKTNAIFLLVKMDKATWTRILKPYNIQYFKQNLVKFKKKGETSA